MKVKVWIISECDINRPKTKVASVSLNLILLYLALSYYSLFAYKPFFLFIRYGFKSIAWFKLFTQYNLDYLNEHSKLKSSIIFGSVGLLLLFKESKRNYCTYSKFLYKLQMVMTSRYISEYSIENLTSSRVYGVCIANIALKAHKITGVWCIVYGVCRGNLIKRLIRFVM